MTQDLPTVAIVITTVVTFVVANEVGLTGPVVPWAIFALGGVAIACLWAFRYRRYELQRAKREGET